MRGGAAIVLVGVLLGAACSSAPKPVQTAPAVEPPAPAAPGPRVEIVIEPLAPELAADPGCHAVADDAARGDHKLAVDRLALLLVEGVECPVEVLTAAGASRSILEQADELVLSSTRHQLEGDLDRARQELLAALDVYPRYHWAAKLLRDLDAAREAAALGSGSESDVEDIRQLVAEQNLELAKRAEDLGDLESASRWAALALKAGPEDARVRRGVIEYARLLGLKLFSAGDLTPARELWALALALDGSDQRLHDYLREVDERLENLERIRSGCG